MKSLRFIHFVFGILALAALLSVAWMFVSPHFQAAEVARVDAVQTRLQAQLDAYQREHGSYPDSLQALTFTNSSRDIQVLQKMSYHHAQTGYTLSYDGSYHSSVTISTTMSYDGSYHSSVTISTTN
jgi:type II secretory pathway pseudopilin PulG